MSHQSLELLSSSRSSYTPKRGVSDSEDDLPELDFMGSSGMGPLHPPLLQTEAKRRAERCDSSESSDSGVVTLSPSTSNSSDITDNLPYSPCCDLSSDGSSSCSSSPESPPPTLIPVKPTSLLGHPIMTAVSAILAAPSSRTVSSPNNTTRTLNNHHGMESPLGDKKAGTAFVSTTFNQKSSNPLSLNCDSNSNQKIGNATVVPSPIISPNGSKNGKNMNILATALSFHKLQQQEKLAKAQSSINNNNISTLSNKNQLPPSKGTLGSSSPSKKPRIESSNESNSNSSKNNLPLIVTRKLSLSTKASLVSDGGRKRRVVEEEQVLSTNVEATVVQNGRVCSVDESINVTTSGGVGDKVSGLCKGCCLWKGCDSTQAVPNLLDHIQTMHVSEQTKAEGYLCLWEGCKVYNRKSSSLSWLERHVLSHSGNKPFKCFFLGCGQSFGVRGALARHVESHVNIAEGTLSIPNRKMESSPFKGPRRKKVRCRKQRLSLGAFVDYFDKRVMEVIKHRLAGSISFYTLSAHHCTFHGQVIAKRTANGQEHQVLVQWYPPSVIPDEWVSVRAYKSEKTVPLTRLPKEKLSRIFPTLLPPSYSNNVRKASRKWKPPTCLENSSIPEKRAIASKVLLEECQDGDDDWAVDALIDSLFVGSSS